jgi:hypothetical protein
MVISGCVMGLALIVVELRCFLLCILCAGTGGFLEDKICHDFVCATSDWRTLYCQTCQRFRQRDVMASENMNNVIKGHLIRQQRPLYLQPRREDGSYPWMDVAVGGGSGGGGKAGGPSAEVIDSIECGNSSGGRAATVSPSMAQATSSGGPTRERRAASIVTFDVANTNVDPMADAPSFSGHTKKWARKK